MSVEQNLEFAFSVEARRRPEFRGSLAEELARFCEFGKSTRIFETVFTTLSGTRVSVPTYVNEFWTSKQRAANSLHEVSYRACFKPQLPRFFVERLTSPREVVYDPFMGRGTTPVEAALCGRIPFACDINPLSEVLTKPRLRPPSVDEITKRLMEIDYSDFERLPDDLLVFYHRETLREICALRRYLLSRKMAGQSDHVDDWIRMVAVNRLTGHSPGFFSVYTLPPNQAVSAKAQAKINEARGQVPPRRYVAEIIARKSQQLLSDCDSDVRQLLSHTWGRARLLTGDACGASEIPVGSVSLVVTSPPFLDVVDYASDNWLRCWFVGVDSDSVRLTVPKKLTDWQAAMTRVFKELGRVLRASGHVAFEVGEVRGGKIRLEEAVVPCGIEAGLTPLLVVINDQKFTKTANCWGVDNNSKGTNTNRIVVFQKPRGRLSERDSQSGSH